MPSPHVHDSDSSSFWRGDHYQQPLLSLQESLLHNKSFVVLTGDPGVGKTTVVHWLVESLADEYVVLVLAGDQANEIALYNSIAKGFGIDKLFTSKVQFFVEFSNFLYKSNEAKTKAVLVIDDCNQLSQDLLEAVRQIGNIEIDGIHPLHLLLVGDSSFLTTLDSSANKALRLSLAMKYHLNPFGLKETAEYVNYRLESVGCLEKIFCLKGLELIHRASQGEVQKINTLCEQVLAKSAAEGKVAVELSSIYETIDQLGMTSSKREPSYVYNSASQSQDEKNLLQQPLTPPPPVTDFTLAQEEEVVTVPIAESDEEKQVLHSEKRGSKKGLWVLVFLAVLAVPALWWMSENRQQLFPKTAITDPKEESPIVDPPASGSAPAEVVEVAKQDKQEIVTETASSLPAKPAEGVIAAPVIVVAEKTRHIESKEEAVLPEVDIVSEVIEYAIGDNQVDAVLEEQLTSLAVVEEVVLAAQPVEQPANAEQLLTKKEPTFQPVKQESVDIENAASSPAQTNEVMGLAHLPVAVETIIPEEPTQAGEASSVVLDEKPIEAIEQRIGSADSSPPELAKLSKKAPSIKEEVADQEIVILEEQSKIEVKANTEHLGVFTTILRQKPGSAKLTPGAYKRFLSFVEQAEIFPRALIVVRGYVSSDTDSAENRELSHKRAMQVEKLFIKEGISPERIEVLGMGIQDPIASNSTPNGRYKNRRVEVELATDALLINKEKNE